MEIELKTCRHMSGSEYRHVYYRIKNSELPWWKRNAVFNPWKSFVYVTFDGWHKDIFDVDEFELLFKHMKTLDDVQKYFQDQEEKDKKINQRWGV